MSSTEKTDWPAIVLKESALDDSERLFSVGCFATRVTVYSQQHRALNLAWALLHDNRLTAASRVAVIGGGFAGLAAAAAFARSHASILLFERQEAVLALQKGCTHRYIHPNIYDWPMAHSFDNWTTLPFMNWSAGRATDIADSVERDWLALGREIAFYPNTSVDCAEDYVAGKGVRLTVGSRGSSPQVLYADLVLFAVGFGIERVLPGTQNVSYWRDDPLHQIPLLESRPKILIIGCGDGGLIDLVRACTIGIDQGRLIREVSRNPAAIELGECLLEWDRTMSNLDPDARDRIAQEKYEAVAVPGALIDQIRKMVRRNVSVTLASRARSPFGGNTALLNRVFVLALREMNAFRYISGAADDLDLPAYGTVVPRIGAAGELENIIGNTRTQRSNSSSGEIARRIATETYWDHRTFHRGASAQRLLRTFILSNAVDRHAESIIDVLRGEIRREVAVRRIECDCCAFKVDPTDAAESSDLTALCAELSRILPDIVFVISSDLARLLPRILTRAACVVLIGESSAMRDAMSTSQYRQKGWPTYTVLQEVDLRDVIDAIELVVPGKRLGYVLDVRYDTDRFFWELLRNVHCNSRAAGVATTTLSKLAPEELVSNKLSEVDVLIGRYFVHANIETILSAGKPFLSGYSADLTRGAIATFDSDGIQSALLAVQEIFLPLLDRQQVTSRTIISRRPQVTASRSNAARWGIALSDAFLARCDVIVE